MERGLEANVLFSRGQYSEALQAYTASLESLAATTRNDFKINLLFNRSACYLKLKSYEKVVEDCDTILSLEKKNGKAIGRKIKAMCSLGKFKEAQSIANIWIKEDPKNPQAKKEVERLDVIIKALNEQASEDDGLDVSGLSPFSELRNHSEGRGDDNSFNSSNSHLAPGAKFSVGVIGKPHTNNNSWLKMSPHSQPQAVTPPRVVPNKPYASVVSPRTVPSPRTPSPHVVNKPLVSQTSSVLTSPTLSSSLGKSALDTFPLNQVHSLPYRSQESPGLPLPHTSANSLDHSCLTRQSPGVIGSPTTSSSVRVTRDLGLVSDSEMASPALAELATGNSELPVSFLPTQSSKPASPSFFKSPTEPETSYQQQQLAPNTDIHSSIPSDREKDNHATKGVVLPTSTRDWKYRPPPRGLTSQEYTKCLLGESGCRSGSQCTQAHSDAELQEWKERFELNKQEVQKHREGEAKFTNYQYIEAIIKKMINTDSTKNILTNSMEGIKIHLNSELKVTMSSKKGSHTWLFTITSKQKSLEKLCLLDDSTRKHFHISEINIGPKRSQRKQILEKNSQIWSNTASDSKNMNERVYRVKVVFVTDIYGTFRQTVIMDFGGEPLLSRELCVDSSPVSDLDKLTQNLVLKENERWDVGVKNIVNFASKPHSLSSDEEFLLAAYPPPTATNFTVSVALLETGLTRENYPVRMHDLLRIEEMAQFSSVSKYNVVAVLQLVDRFLLMPSSTASEMKFAQNGELFGRLKLNSNLSEDSSHGRLILQNVHTVYLAPECKADKRSDRIYEALVEDKGKNFIFLRLSKMCVEELKLRVDMDFSVQVQFQLNRLPLCEMHLAVDKLPDLHVVFPQLEGLPTIPWNPQRQWKEKLDSRLNPKQREAVVAITTGLDVRLPPILLIGPYGTGKTFTLAQAAKAILRQEGTRILICTHSNSAADLYVKDYLHPFVEEGQPEAKPLRIIYRHRWVQTVPSVVLQYCLKNQDRTGAYFRMPTKEDIEAHRVVVATLSTSRYLHNIGLQTGFFTHILLDEAAQAMEAEMLLPIALASETTKIVLAGDHMQLSPEVHSDFAHDRNLHMSFLERLYDLYPVAHSCKILLCENYRSHKAIIDYTSELFYDNKLVASGNQPAHPKFFPLSFFTASGEDVQHQNSTAFYNNAEVYEVVERVAELTKAWPGDWGNMADNGIGVVAPYADQVVRIRSELRKKKMYNISVERVLNVQGKQFRVILLSTVRTRHTCSSDTTAEDYVDYGFLSNIKLLNTAITRAQSLVAVVGDPVSLCSIGKCRKLWERFIELCHKNNSLYGLTWQHIRGQLDGVELKKTYILNPLAPEFIPNRLRHAAYTPPEPIAFGKFGYTFAPHQQLPSGGPGQQYWQPGPRFPSGVMGPFIPPQMLYPWLNVPGPGYYGPHHLYGSGMIPPQFVPHAVPPQWRLAGPPPHTPVLPGQGNGGSNPTSPRAASEALAGQPLQAGHPLMYPSIHPTDLAQHLIGQPLARLPGRGQRPRQDSGGRPGSAGSHRERNQSGDTSKGPFSRHGNSEGERDSGIQFLPSACNVQRTPVEHMDTGVSAASLAGPSLHMAPTGMSTGRINPVMFNTHLQQELARYMLHKEGQDQASRFLNQLLQKGNMAQQPSPVSHALSQHGYHGPMAQGSQAAPPPPFEHISAHVPQFSQSPTSPGAAPTVRGLRYSDLVSREHANYLDSQTNSYAGVTKVSDSQQCDYHPLSRRTPVVTSPPAPLYQSQEYRPPPKDSYQGSGISSHSTSQTINNPLFMAGAIGGKQEEAEGNKPVAVDQVEQFLHSLEDSTDSISFRSRLQGSADSSQMRGILHGSTDSAQLHSLLGNLDDSSNSDNMKEFYRGMDENKDSTRYASGKEPQGLLTGIEEDRRSSAGAVGEKLPLYMRSIGPTPDQASGVYAGAVGTSVSSEDSRPMSYAGALKSRPPAPSPQPPPVPPADDDTSPDPLDYLKNLNIKASPGTQALYQYFS